MAAPATNASIKAGEVITLMNFVILFLFVFISLNFFMVEHVLSYPCNIRAMSINIAAKTCNMKAMSVNIGVKACNIRAMSINIGAKACNIMAMLINIGTKAINIATKACQTVA